MYLALIMVVLTVANMSKVEDRMVELCKPIDRQIMMCDNYNDGLMLACAMLQKVKTILDVHIGEAGRKQVISEANEK